MASISSLSAPGVEVREYDESIRIQSNTGTTVFIPGFAQQGPVEEVIQISSITDFENVYGIPTNAAERYFYYTVLAVLENSGQGTTVLCSRLGYGAGEGDTVATAYTLLAYPAIPVVKNLTNTKGYTHWVLNGSVETVTNGRSRNAQSTVVADGIYKALTLNIQEVSAPENEGDSPVISVSKQIIPASIESEIILHADYISNESITISAIKNGTNGIPSGLVTSLGANDYPIITVDIDSTSIKCAADICVESDTNTGKVKVELAAPICAEDNMYGNLLITVTYDDVDLANLCANGGWAGTKFTGVIFNGIEDGGAAVTTNKVEAFNKIGKEYAPDYNEDEPADDTRDITYLIGAPATYNVSLDEYYQIITGEYFKWSSTNNTFKKDGEGCLGGELKDVLGKAAFITINTSRSTITDGYEGFYLGLTDNLFNTASADYTYNSINKVQFTSWNRESTADNKSCIGIVDYASARNDEFTEISKNRLDFYLDSNTRGSISNVLQTTTTSFDTSAEEYDDTLSFGLFKLAKSTVGTESMKLTYNTVETYNASLGKARTYSISTAIRPQSYFVETIMEGSKNITIMVNPHIAERIHIDINGKLRGKVRTYSSKLIDNYKFYEGKYLAKSVSTSTDSLKTAIKSARLNIANWKALVDQIGVPLEFLNEIAAKSVQDGDYECFNKTDSLYPFATYTVVKKNNKYIGSVPAKVKRTLELISNDEEYPDIDLILEGGLSTIYAYSNAKTIISEGSTSIFNTETNGVGGTNEQNTNENIFVEDAILQGIEDMRTSRSVITEDADLVIQDYMSVQQAFQTLADSFQNGGRGDCFYIPDILRGIVVRGKDTKVEKLYGSSLKNNTYVENDNVKHSWATSILSPIKHLVNGFTTSYASIYAQWLKVNDGFTNEKFWVPASGYMAALMCASDQLQGPWYAAAGLNRGIISGVIDCALNPNQKQRGDLYKICVNSVPKISGVGITCWGIRTLSKKASAFDQNTCRRTFLFIEKAVKKLLRYYLFEPNNSYTQLSIYNEIEPYMESIRNQGGIYSYSVVCNSSNNTPEVVNAGNLAVDISAAPTRTAEFIVLNMTANKYTQDVATSEFNI